MKQITLIWQISHLEYIRFEFEWITKVIFAAFEQEHIMNDQYQTVRDGAVIIYPCNERKAFPEFIRYIKKYEKEDKSFYLYHISNENLDHDAWYYPKARHVFRTYVDPLLFKMNNVTFVPLGFQSGLQNYSDMINLNKRKYPFTFIGQVKSDRQLLIKCISSVPDSFIHTTKKWNCPTALKYYETCNIYANTDFVPCPKGWIHADSFRICEALEWGAIPVLKKYDSYSYKWMGENHPIPIVNDWKEMLDLMNTDIKKLRMDCWHWYSQKKMSLSLEILLKIEKI